MKKLVAIIAGDPESISSELIAKAWKRKQQFKNINIFVIGNYDLLEKQLKFLNIKINIKKINNLKTESFKKSLSIYDIPLNFKKPFKINKNLKKKICFKVFRISN